MPKRSQMDYKRPQTAYKTRREQTTYSRSSHDETIANNAMLRVSLRHAYQHIDNPVVKHSERRAIKRRATVKKISPYLGMWKGGSAYAPSEVVIEPSKYFSKHYLYQEKTRIWGADCYSTTCKLLTAR